jgi:hypothetical protein
VQDLPYDSLFEDSLDIHAIDWIVVFAYFDETGTHGAATESVICGYVFSKDGAKLFRRMFQENIYPLLPLDKNGIRMYHSTKCILGYDQFESIGSEAREHIVDLLVDAIKASVTLGIMVGMEKSEYQKAITSTPQLKELAGSEYSVCVIRCIEDIAGWLESQNIKGRIEYVFESGCQHEPEAKDILSRISQSDELKLRYRWHDYSFRQKHPDIPQLFAPDLLAWEWQRAVMNASNPQRGEWRLTLKKLRHGPPPTSHIYEYQDAKSVGLRALINSWYGLTKTDGPVHIKI